MTLGESSEDQIIERICSQLTQRSDILVGPGDDCAVVQLENGALQLQKTDCVVEGVHFYPEEMAERVGWKAMARVVSDIAAMGGTPSSMLVTLILRSDTKLAWLEALYQGIQNCANTFDFSIVGGETSSAPKDSANMLSIAGTGNVTKDNLILRSTANQGDTIFVTGRLGGSLTGKHLDFTPRVKESQWLANHCKPSAMMDLSDGLAKDLPRLAKLSNLGFLLDPQTLPISPNCTVEQALGDGEDYELLFTLPTQQVEYLLSNWPGDLTPLTQIGILEQRSETNTALDGGWDHFY
ncbi:thiamine-monophosphate kinase [Rubritalea spongiae]|uniref:Thiamine-monophosphate kinase n=1 Tax=Rubritalea spongiae TaxID=430797 RepID=A0ABW5E1D9_9BACT